MKLNRQKLFIIKGKAKRGDNMAKKKTVTDDDIAVYDNVPVEVAAKYLGNSTSTIYYALQDGTAPYGYATRVPDPDESSHYIYNISPGLIRAYKNGTLPISPLGKLLELVSEQLKIALSADKLVMLTLESAARTYKAVVADIGVKQSLDENDE